jgi:LuxR family transcriptional regulator, maltose regulon positive regulatory protein
MQLQDPIPFAPAARELTLDRQMIGNPAMDPFVSLVVVRDGVAEAFLLGPPTTAALDHGAAAVSAAIAGAGDRASDFADDVALFSSAGSGGSASLEDPVRGSESGISLVSKLMSLLGGGSPVRSSRGEQQDLSDQLTGAEIRVLRFLPSNLTAWEIADELCLSLNTVKTHMRHIYAKLNAHRRREAVERARALGLLPSTSRRRPDPNAFA